MSRSTKLGLDLLLGAVVPILALSYLTQPLGAVPAYLISALVPVGWVFVDLLFITRRFNFITAYVGLGAVVRGLLAFWFVDGALFALKDSMGNIVPTVVFGGSLLVARPVMQYLLVQHLDPQTPEQDKTVWNVFREPAVYRALRRGTGLVAATHAFTTLANFLLNFYLVTAAFGSELFNRQVAQVNAITRIALSAPEFIAFGVAFWIILHALQNHYPPGEAPPGLARD